MGDRGLGSRSINSSMMIQKVVIILLGITVLCLVFYIIASSNNYFGEYVPSLSVGLSSPIYNMIGASSWGDQDDLVQVEYNELSKVLKAASTEDKTVILVTLNGAWAEPNSVFDVFLESFRVGNNTARLLKHLLVIAVDEKAYSRCQQTVSHCYFLKSNQTGEMAHEAKFMSPVYIELMWKRLAFLRIILTYGYNFVQTDTDVVWFRDPFPHFNDLDFQTSCDRFNGKPHSLKNPPNNGFAFVRSNKRTIAFYKFWISSRFKYPKLHEQDTFDKIKYDPIVKKIGLKLRFLDTVYFGGFCELSKDFNKVCTMHANCCTGLQRKVDDLNTALENWKLYLYLSVHQKAASQHLHWTVPHNCHM